MKLGFKRLLAVVAGVACATLGWSMSASAESPQGMRLYAFSSGFLNLDKAFLQNGAKHEMLMWPVGFFLIHHPKGNILFDTGNNDKVLTDPTYWGPMAAMLSDPNLSRSPDLAIDKQLEKAGFKPSDINYLVVGHMHLDHAGNISKFPNATLIVQHDEIQTAFWPPPVYNCCYVPGDFAYLRWSPTNPTHQTPKVIELKGDLDLFGDGSVFIHRQPGHTPGSQMMVVRLPKTGAVVLTSDNCYMPENLDKDLLPSVALAYDPAGMLRAYQWIKHLRDVEGAKVFMAHDIEGWKTRKHSPEYYE